MKGSYYILNSIILYNTIDSGLGHPSFWKEIVKNFTVGNYDLTTLKELIEACYATDRGRVTIEDEEPLLIGTPGSKKYLKSLKKIFDLKKCQVNFNDDVHYKIVKGDAKLLEECPLTLPQAKIIKYTLGGIFEIKK